MAQTELTVDIVEEAVGPVVVGRVQVNRAAHLAGWLVVPARTSRPSMKSVAVSALSSGAQRSMFDCASTASERLTVRSLSTCWNGAPGLRTNAVQPVAEVCGSCGSFGYVCWLQIDRHSLPKFVALFEPDLLTIPRSLCLRSNCNFVGEAQPSGSPSNVHCHRHVATQGATATF